MLDERMSNVPEKGFVYIVKDDYFYVVDWTAAKNPL